MRYRPEVDGLRALAVLPVIFFHAGFELFSGGYVGVDVFFVISGYLITGIIYTEIQERSFSIVRFYERRVRRILPALLLVSLACIPFAWLWMLPDEFKDFAQSLVAINVFASNILFWQESGYFAAAAELKPLLHTWSLAVEEQFYVIFPLFLLLCRRLTQNRLLALLLVLTVVSLALAQWASATHPVANFYLLPTRAWELGVGAILAVTVKNWIHRDGPVAQIGSAAGLAMIVYAIFAFDATVPFPSVWALIPVLGTALIIACARPSTLVGTVLSWRPIVGVGLISYSAYLWHQPLFAFARIRFLNEVTPATYLILSVVALGLAYLSWRFVERPFRNKTRFSRRQIFSGAVAVSALVMAFGLFGHVRSGLPDRISPDVIAMAAWSDDVSPLRMECHANEERLITPQTACDLGQGNSDALVLWGDSHGVELAWQLSNELEAFDRPVKQLTHSACVPSVGVYHPSFADHCVQFNRRVMAYFAEQSPTTIVMIGRWSATLELTRFDNQEGGVEKNKSGDVVLPIGKGRDAIQDLNRISDVGERYRGTIETLLGQGHRVVFVYHVPEVGWNVPQYLAREIQHGIDRQEPLSTSYRVFEAWAANTHEQFDLLADNPKLIRIRPEDVFCNTSVAGRCVAQMDGKPLYFDDHHLNNIGAGMLADAIVAVMHNRGWLKN